LGKIGCAGIEYHYNYWRLALVRRMADKIGKALGLSIGLGLATSTVFAKSALSGEQIYSRLCADCHGDKGQGVADEYDEPLVGDWSIEKLASNISKTMPEDEEELCTGEEAKRVARYIFDSFYSPAAQARNHPARVGLARLTERQYLHSIADLLGNFTGRATFGQSGGMKGTYHNSRNLRRNDKSFERTDAVVDFQFGSGTPAPGREGFKPEEFSANWIGSVMAEETGDYEFFITTENGANLWVNRMNRKLIDAWVSNGKLREAKGTVRLIGGRAYPLKLDFFKFKEASASIRLEWKPPHGVRQLIPARCLSPRTTQRTVVVQQPFPPDDRSIGYERGSAVSKKWDEAATFAAIEVANLVADRLNSFADASPGDELRETKVRAFCSRFVELAFRRPLTPEQQRLFIDSQFDQGKADTDSVKKVILLALKSPRFLYPDLGHADGHAVAARLALTLWDSLPDAELRRAAAAGRLSTPEQARQQALRMLGDPRSRAKLRVALHHWIGIDEAADIAKDPDVFPGYDKTLEADLRTSLNLFIDSVIWQGAGADYRKLLTTGSIPFNERLAKFYGAKPVTDAEEFIPAWLDQEERAGLLTHPYLLAMFSYHNTTSPIHRGVFVARRVLGRELKPPPEATVFKNDEFDPHMTMREKITYITSDGGCMSCHSLINPTGFALERFDGVGRARQTEKGRPINTTSDFQTDEGQMIRLANAQDIASHAVSSPVAQRAFVESLFNQLAKQPVQAYGSGLLNRLRDDFVRSGFNVQFLLAETAVTAALHGINPATPVERK
jgi:mono/diheme cytochrome c family protein